MEEWRAFWAAWGVTQIGYELGCVKPHVCSERQASGRPGGMAVDHAQSGTPFGMTLGLGQVGLHDPA